jgi:hypothetical protein
MTCRQIWLSPLADDGQFTDLTKSGKKKTFDHQEAVALKPVFLFVANFAPKKKEKKCRAIYTKVSLLRK